METNWRDLVDVMRDRDWFTISLLVSFAFSFLGIRLDILTKNDPWLLLIATIFSRALFMYRFNSKVDKIYEEILQRINKERKKPGFINGSLETILETYFKRINKRIKDKCVKKLEENCEIEMSSSGYHIFYRHKIVRKENTTFNPYK
jgi:hypothetical protein